MVYVFAGVILFNIVATQEVAASCIFLATKTEECGRKLRDVARICQVKITGRDVLPESKVMATGLIDDPSPIYSVQEVEQCQASILLTEEVLLEALCFDYVVESPHSKLVDLFDAHDDDMMVQECAWSFAHDSSVRIHLRRSIHDLVT